MKLFVMMCALLASGCASKLGLIHVGTGQWPTSCTIEQRVWNEGAARTAIGFIELSELALASVLMSSPAAEDHSPGRIVGATLLGVDGLATLVMAFAIPDTEYHHQRIDPPRDYDVFACPPDVGFEVEGQVFAVRPDGALGFEQNLALVEAVVLRNAPIALRSRDSVRTTLVPPEVRCLEAAMPR